VVSGTADNSTEVLSGNCAMHKRVERRDLK